MLKQRDFKPSGGHIFYPFLDIYFDLTLKMSSLRNHGVSDLCVGLESRGVQVDNGLGARDVIKSFRRHQAPIFAI